MSKTISEKPLAEWRAFVSQLSDGWTVVTTPLTVQKDVSFHGLPARMKSTPMNGKNLGWPKTFSTSQFIREDVFYYTGTEIPHEAAQILNTLFDQGTAPDLVLGLTLLRKNGTFHKQVWTESNGMVDVPADFFEPPHGLRKADLAQVFGNVTAPTSDIKDMIEGVGLGNDLGKGIHKD